MYPPERQSGGSLGVIPDSHPPRDKGNHGRLPDCKQQQESQVSFNSCQLHQGAQHAREQDRGRSEIEATKSLVCDRNAKDRDKTTHQSAHDAAHPGEKRNEPRLLTLRRRLLTLRFFAVGASPRACASVSCFCAPEAGSALVEIGGGFL